MDIIEYPVEKLEEVEDELFTCSTCNDTHKVIVNRGTEDEEVEPCPDCSLSEESDFSRVSDEER